MKNKYKFILAGVLLLGVLFLFNYFPKENITITGLAPIKLNPVVVP